MLPKDIEPGKLMAAIDAKLHGSSGAQKMLERRAGGHVVVPAAHLLRLGNGDLANGRKYLQGIVWQMRRQRMRRNRR